MPGQVPGTGRGPVFQPHKPPPPTVAPFDDSQRGRGLDRADTSQPGAGPASRRVGLTPSGAALTTIDSAHLRPYACAWVYPSNWAYPLLSFGAQVTPTSADGSTMTVQVQSSTDIAFTAPTTVTLVSQVSGVTTTAAVGPFTNDTVYFFRARAGDGVSTWSEWTPTRRIYLNVVGGDALEYTYQNLGWLNDAVSRDALEYTYQNLGVELPRWDNALEYTYQNVGVELPLNKDAVEYVYYGDVNADPPLPYLWTMVPSSGRANDGITLYGGGMGTAQGTYSGVVQMLLSGVWTNVSVVSWIRVAANANATTGARSIQPLLGIVDPEHNEVGIAIPSTAMPPGHQVRVQTVT